MLIALTIGYTQQVETPLATPIATPEPVVESTPELTPEPEPETTPTPEPTPEPIPDNNWYELFLTVEDYKDMPTEDVLDAFDELFGIKHERGRNPMIWKHEDGTEISATFMGGKLDSVTFKYIGMIDDADLSFFYNPDVVFDMDGILALKNNKYAMDRPDRPNNLVFILDLENNNPIGVSYNDILKLTGGDEGMPTAWWRVAGGFSDFNWYDGEYFLYLAIIENKSVNVVSFFTH